MRNIAIYGAGGLGREVACIIDMINKQEKQWNLIGFFDDNKPIGEKNEYGVFLGGIESLNAYKKKLAIVVALGDPRVLKAVVEKIHNPFLEYPNIISPDIQYLDKESVSMGKGNIFLLACNVSCNVHIGNFNVFNGNIPIGHDVIIGSFNNIMPSVNISGEVVIGDCNFLGVQSVVLQKLKIGDNIRLGANSVLMRNAKVEALYFGNPATIIRL